MPESARKWATYDDLYNIPESMIGEIIDGELIATPRPSRAHANVSSVLGGEIVPAYRLGKGGPGGWVILDEPEIAFGDNILVPDLAGWKKERFPVKEAHNWISVAPDWVCEIVSHSSIRHDRIVKANTYAKYRVPYFWLIDPHNKTLDVLMLESGRWVTIGVYAETDKVRDEPFQEVEIDLANLWLEEQ